MTEACLPRVSVLMPAYNAAAYVEAAIASALGQSEADLEVLVVDDASTDDTAERVRRLAAHDGRVRLLLSPANAGPGAARNLGLAAAHGAWVALLDADDRFQPRRLETLLALAARHGADVVSDNLAFCDEDQRPTGRTVIPATALPHPAPLTAAEFVRRDVGSRRGPRTNYGFMQPVFRRAFLDAHGLRYDERNRFGEDFLFALACLVRGARWWVTPEPLYLCTVRPGSLTQVQSAADLRRVGEAEARLLARPEVASDPELARALRLHKRGIDRRYHYRAFTDALKAGNYGRAAALLVERPDSLGHVAHEGLAQAPTILAKAVRGGYRRAGTTSSGPRPPRAAGSLTRLAGWGAGRLGADGGCPPSARGDSA